MPGRGSGMGVAEGGEPGLRGALPSCPAGSRPLSAGSPRTGAGQRPRSGEGWRGQGGLGSSVPGSAVRWAAEEEEEGGAVSATEKFLPATIFPAVPSAPWPRPGIQRGQDGSGRAALGAAPAVSPGFSRSRWNWPRDAVHLWSAPAAARAALPGAERPSRPHSPRPALRTQPQPPVSLPGSSPALRPAEMMMMMTSPGSGGWHGGLAPDLF